MKILEQLLLIMEMIWLSTRRPLFQRLDANAKVIQQINFNGYLDWVGNTRFSITEEVKETILDFSKSSVRGF